MSETIGSPRPGCEIAPTTRPAALGLDFHKGRALSRGSGFRLALASTAREAATSAVI